MKRTVIDYLNICFATIFILLVILYGIELFKNNEFEKLDWDAKIVSKDRNSTTEKPNMIKVVDAVFVNTSNDFKNAVHFDSRNLIFSKGNDSVYFWGAHNLLPDSLSLRYFSVDEKRFYVLNTKLSKENLKKTIDNKGFQTVLSINIEPKGKISLYVEQLKNVSFQSKLLQKFNAKETQGKLNELVYRKSFGEYFNDFPSLETVSDYTDIMTKKFPWSVKIETESEETVNEISINAFDERTIGFMDEKFVDVKVRYLPSRFLINWGNTQKYGSNYYFDAKEILEAFKNLSEIKSDEPIVLHFKLLKNGFPKCEISKGEKTFPLKNLYPENPIHYIK